LVISTAYCRVGSDADSFADHVANHVANLAPDDASFHDVD